MDPAARTQADTPRGRKGEEPFRFIVLIEGTEPKRPLFFVSFQSGRARLAAPTGTARYPGEESHLHFGSPDNVGIGADDADADGDGNVNLFEFITATNPVDSDSHFALKIALVAGQPTQKDLIFSPCFNDRTYAVKAKTSLLTLGGWAAINASTPSDNGPERTITDLNASGTVKFYHIEITKP